MALMHARTCICDTHDVDELEQYLTKVCSHGVAGLGRSVIDDEWHAKRLWACVHVKGGHFG